MSESNVRSLKEFVASRAFRNAVRLPPGVHHVGGDGLNDEEYNSQKTGGGMIENIKKYPVAWISYGLALVCLLLGLFNESSIKEVQHLPFIASAIMLVWGIYEHLFPLQSEQKKLRAKKN